MKLKIIPITLRKYKPPTVTVYKGGTVSFSKACIDEYLIPNDIKYIKVGKDEADRLVIVKSDSPKDAVKINYGLQNHSAQIGNAEFSEQAGMPKNTKYDIEKITDKEGVYLILTLV